MYIRNLFLAVVLEQTPHIARILNSEGCIFEDDEMMMSYGVHLIVKNDCCSLFNTLSDMPCEKLHVKFMNIYYQFIKRQQIWLLWVSK